MLVCLSHGFVHKTKQTRILFSLSIFSNCAPIFLQSRISLISIFYFYFKMKALVQRVLNAKVTVGDELVGSIGKGICVLIGISRHDTAKDTEFMVRKLLNLRLFEDENGKTWEKSVKDLNLEILCVSQFTLQCVLKGNKPDFHQAMAAGSSEQFYNDFLKELRKSYVPEKIQEGRFGALMQVHIQNDGPVTIEVNSPPPKTSKKSYQEKQKQPAAEEET